MRRLRFPPILIALAVWLHPSSAAGDPIADALWKDLDATRWGSPYPGWQRTNPKIRCEQFSRTTADLGGEEQWCARCQVKRDKHASEWSFYAWGTERRPACRLDQFRAFVEGYPPTDLSRIHGALAGRLDARYGRGEDPGRAVSEFDPYWREIRRWWTGALEILLYREEHPTRPPMLGVLARHSVLLDALAQERRFRYAEWEWLERADHRLTLRMSQHLGGSFPDLAQLLARLADPNQPRFKDRATREEVHSALRRLLEAAGRASGEDRAALLLAVDCLAVYLGHDQEHSAEWDEKRKQLAAHGLSYEWSPLGAVWVYGRDLLWRVWRQHGGTPWGEEAFALLLNYGWDTSFGCGGGSDGFRAVMREGERFLARRPKSPHRVQVLLATAQAYETWWSLGHASDQDEHVERTKYQAGARTALAKAIAYYEEVLRRAPGSPESAFARRQLPRLRLGVPTNQRRFYCVYD